MQVVRRDSRAEEEGRERAVVRDAYVNVLVVVVGGRKGEARIRRESCWSLRVWASLRGGRLGVPMYVSCGLEQ